MKGRRGSVPGWETREGGLCQRIWGRVRARRVGGKGPRPDGSEPWGGGALGSAPRYGGPEMGGPSAPGQGPRDGPRIGMLHNPGWGRGGGNPQRVETPDLGGSSPPYLSAAASPAALPKHGPEPAQVGADGGRDLQRRVEARAHPEQGRPGGG